MPDQVGRPAGSIGNEWQAVGPCLQKHQAEGVGSARQREQVDAGEEIAPFLVVEQARNADAFCLLESGKEPPEVLHLWPGQQQVELVTLFPQARTGLEQIDRAFLVAEVGQMADYQGSGWQIEALPAAQAFAATAFRGPHAQALQDDSALRDSQAQYRVAF